MFYIVVLLLIAITVFLAKKDGDSYRLESTHTASMIPLISTWHTDGSILFGLIIGTIAYTSKEYWQIPTIGLLLRLALYDIAFNCFAGLSITYIGSTATTDKIFSSIFGVNGEIKKSIAFSVLLISFVILKAVLKF